MDILSDTENPIPYARELEAELKRSGVRNDTIELENPSNIGLRDGKPVLIDAGGMSVPRLSPEARERYRKTVKALKK